MAGQEAFTDTLVHDVGAIVYYLKALPWQAPGFEARDHAGALRAIHAAIETAGPLTIRAHHFLVDAMRPA